MKSVSCVHLKLFILLVAVVNSLCQSSNLCCQLELAKVIEKGEKRFIPSSALSVGKTALGFDIYYFFNSRYEVGIINSTSGGRPFVASRKDYVPWKDGYVLTNPNNCVLQWQGNRGNVPVETNSRHFVLDGHIYGPYCKFEDPQKFGSSLYGSFVTSKRAFVGLNMDSEKFFEGKFDKPLQFLYVDCFATLKNQVVAELYDIDFSRKSMVKDEKVLASAELINESETEQTFQVSLRAESVTSLEMSHETTLPKFVSAKWRVNAIPSASLRLIEDLLELSSFDSTEKNCSKMKYEFVESGNLFFGSKKLVFKFDQQVKVRAKNIAKVLIKSKPIGGQGQLTAHYRIRSKVFQKMWTNQRILDSLERLGFNNLDKLQKSPEGLKLAVKGRISLKTATDTHVSILSQPLDFSKTSEVVKTSLTATDAFWL